MARGAGGVGAVGVPDQPQGAATSARMYATVLSTMPPISLQCFSLMQVRRSPARVGAGGGGRSG